LRQGPGQQGDGDRPKAAFEALDGLQGAGRRDFDLGQPFLAAGLVIGQPLLDGRQPLALPTI
jgi:hypothetical protein